MTSLPSRIAVISDLHMGSKERCIFTAHAALAGFIDALTKGPSPVELVVLGDAVDFLQLTPFLDFTAATGVTKATSIVAEYKAVFDALGRFASGVGRTLRWFVGNHDVELLFPAVRKVLEDAVGAPITWHLTQERHDYELPSMAILRLGHGNHADPWNEVDLKETAKLIDAGKEADFRYPPGSRLVADVINPLKADGFKHIDLLKPEQSVALPLSLALWPKETKAYLAKALPNLFVATSRGVKAHIKEWWSKGNDRAFGPPPAPVAEATGEEAMLAATLRHIVNHDPADAKGKGAEERAKKLQALLADDMIETLIQGPTGGRAFSGGLRGLGSDLLRSASRRANDSASPWAIDEPDELVSFADKSFSGGNPDKVALVVAGHTHLARAMERNSGAYLNTGTWADLMRIPRNLADADFDALATSLKEALAKPETAPWALRPFRRLTYVDIRIDPGEGREWRADLREWLAEDSDVLYRFP